MSSQGQGKRHVAKRGKGGFWGFVRAVFIAGLIVFVIGPVVMVVIYRFLPPPVTFLMVQRTIEGRGFERKWVPLDEISPNLVRAVIAGEDARFCEHFGFDVEAIEKAMAANQAGKKLRGGSTISQQTAKNVFLWPGRDWVRKGLETWFTALIEVGWGKRRIMEVYLNSIEWGPGVYGAEAAARKNFKVPAKSLTVAQSARLAAILPSPLKWKAAKPGPYVQKRSGRITRNARAVRREGLTACVL
jgi:monofunctional biosynthetic peptidoglycan transglycosylase